MQEGQTEVAGTVSSSYPRGQLQVRRRNTGAFTFCSYGTLKSRRAISFHFRSYVKMARPRSPQSLHDWIQVQGAHSADVAAPPFPPIRCRVRPFRRETPLAGPLQLRT